MAGIATIMESLNKKYAELKKEHAKILKGFDAFKKATALQLKNWSVGMEKMSSTMTIMSKGIDERFKILEKKPCMKIEEIFSPKQIKEILKLII